MINVLLVDDHPYLVEGLKAILKEAPFIEVVGEAYSGEEVMAALQSTKIDVVVLDLRIPEKTGEDPTSKIGQEVAGKIINLYPQIKIIVLTMSNQKNHILSLMQKGIKGYLLKNKSSDELVEAIETVQEGGTHFKGDVLTLATQANAKEEPDIGKLTKREREIANHVGQCLTTSEISAKLFIAETTVEPHIRNILTKLKLKNRYELVRFVTKNETME